MLDDATGKVATDSDRLTNGLAGAILLELAVGGRVGLTTGSPDGPGGADARPGRLVPLPAPAPGDAELTTAVQVLTERAGRKPKDLLGPLGKGLKDRLLQRLAAEGMLTAQRGKLLGLIPTTRWPASDPEPENEVRARLWRVLVDGDEPDPRTAALVSVLSATDVVTTVLPGTDEPSVKRRAQRIAEGQWAPEAVRKAVAETEAAVMAAIMVSTVAATAGTAT